MTVYKKVRMLKDGNCYPLFINKTKPFVFGEWIKSEFHPTNGFAPRSIGTDSSGNEVGGWHCCFLPIAPHLSDKLKSGEERVWIECEMTGRYKAYDRPLLQGGKWILCEYIKPIKVLTEKEVSSILDKNKTMIIDKDKLINELKNLKDMSFMLAMKDYWNRDDYDLDKKLSHSIRELEFQLEGI